MKAGFRGGARYRPALKPDHALSGGGVGMSGGGPLKGGIGSKGGGAL